MTTLPFDPTAIGYHLGDPCIHCGVRHHDVEPGLCASATGLGAHIRNIQYLSVYLKQYEEKAAAESARLRSMITTEKTFLLRTEAGLDTAQIALAETVMYAWDYARGGSDRDSARQDAIKWFTTGKAGYRGLRHEYFGTKSYDRWHGQREDHEYGCGPRHGSMIFEIGLKREARDRELTAEEREACIYYCVNLERIQAITAAAKEAAQ